MTLIPVLRKKKIEDEEGSLKQIGCVERNYFYSDTKMNIFFFRFVFCFRARGSMLLRKILGEKKGILISLEVKFSPPFGKKSKR